MVTGRMPDGTTLRILNPPLAADGRLIVLERPHATTLSLEDLVRVGVIEETLAQRVKDTLHAHRGIAVCGGSHERRAAVVSALLRALPAGQRLLVLDGPRNLSPRREGAVLMDRLSVLQMGPMAASVLVALHPDLVAVGDVDPEVLALLARLATGARPGLVLSAPCTAEQLPDHLAAAFQVGLPGLDEAGARNLAATVVDVAVDLAADEEGRSHVSRVTGWAEPGRRFGA